MYEPKYAKDIRCPLEYGLKVFGGKWKSRIICVLAEKKKLRYSALRRDMANISDAILAATLKELIADQLVAREQFNEIPPRVEYSLTEKGRSLVPFLRNICRWSGQYHDFEQLSEDALAHCKNCVISKYHAADRSCGECSQPETCNSCDQATS